MLKNLKRLAVSAAVLAMASFGTTAAHADGTYIGTGESYRIGGTTYVTLYPNQGGQIELIGTTGSCNGPGNGYDFMADYINSGRLNFTIFSCGARLVQLCLKVNRGGYECSAYARNN